MNTTNPNPEANRTATVAPPEVYRLVSIERGSAPAPGVGDDWIVYRIARGANVLTGYRRGTRASVTFDVERIVEAINQRLLVRPRRVHIQLGRSSQPEPSSQALEKDLA
jgi:hypothetical protein